MPDPNHPRKTAIILTALEVETSAVLRHLPGHYTETVGGTVFFRARFKHCDVAVAEVGAGNVAAAIIAVRACEHYSPDIALFVGVAGGFKDVAISDVVVATKVYGYESGKDKSDGFQIRPALFATAHSLEQKARAMRQAGRWQTRLNSQIDHSNPRLFIGPLAAGEKVVASKVVKTAKFLRDNYGDTLAVEMEGRGFLEGVHISHPVEGCVIRGISDLLSGKANADRSGSQLRAADAASAVAFEMLSELTEDTRKLPIINPSKNIDGDSTLDIEALKSLSSTLLDITQPPSMAMLFPNASASISQAMHDSLAFERTVAEVNGTGDRLRNPIISLLSLQKSRHLVIGPPGSGKTHALWQAAKYQLDTGGIIPMFLRAAQLLRWDDLSSIIREAAPELSLEKILRDPRVCVFIDGWSEFAQGEFIGEKQKVLRALSHTRVVASGKTADVSDTNFTCWSLDLLPPEQVTKTLNTARPSASLPSTDVLDLLRLPLLLSIYVFSDAVLTGTGDLLRQLHEQLARDLPENFSKILSETVAASTLLKDRSYGRFILDLQTRANVENIKESARLLRRLGTITEQGGQAVPIHDLYWSWLAGRGLMANALTDVAIDNLQTRESYRLAAQSGSRPRESDIIAALGEDLVLAATLDASMRSARVSQKFAQCLDRALSDERLSVRNRGMLACLESGRPAFLKTALSALSALSTAGLYVLEWQEAIKPHSLFSQQVVLADWIGSEGSEFVLDAIAERGGPEWAPWLEQTATEGKITWPEALYTALGCTGSIPTWGHSYLNELFHAKPWKMRAVAERRNNLALARHIAFQYNQIINYVIKENSAAWIDLNRVIVGCGDDETFGILLLNYDNMTEKAQRLLCYAFVERGQPWIEALQRFAFVRPSQVMDHKLSEVVSPGIDDSTAREWISAGHYEEGWRVLIATHGAAVVPELISELPESFAGLHDIPPLAVMRFLDEAPAFLPDELLKRLGSPMQPKAMQDMLSAMATAYPGGVASIVRFISQQPDSLSAFYINDAIEMYKPWREKFGGELMVMFDGGETDTFPRWIAKRTALRAWEDYFTPAMLSNLPEVAMDLVLVEFRNDYEKSAEILAAMRGLNNYNHSLFMHMLNASRLTKLIPSVFKDCFDTFPVSALHSCLVSSEIDLATLLWRLSATSNPLHRSFHLELIRRVLCDDTDLNHFRYIANMLRVHSTEDVLLILRETRIENEDRWLWLAREVESARLERLINENGEIRTVQ